MCDPVTAIVGSAIIGAGASALQGSANRRQAQRAQDENTRQAERQAQRAEEQFNRANQKQPAMASLMSANQRAAGKGVSSTFLTGPTGAALGALGGGSLLGG